MLKKLIGVGMAIVMAFTVGLGFVGKADASPISTGFNAYPKLGKDGHVYANWYNLQHYSNSGVSIKGASVYKMYKLENEIITAVNVYDDTDIIHFSEKMHPFTNQAFVRVTFLEKNNNDYKIYDIGLNGLYLDGLLRGQELDSKYDVHTYKVTWTDDNYVYLYTKNHPNPHEIKLPKEGFEFLTAGDWLWAKVSEETWKWVSYGEITPNGLSSVVNVE